MDPAALLAARIEPHKKEADPQGDPLRVKLTKRRNQKSSQTKRYTAMIKLQCNSLFCYDNWYKKHLLIIQNLITT